MSRWFRFYDEALNDRKVQSLSGDLFKAWINLLCLASKSGGAIASISDAAFALRASEAKAGAIIADLASKGLLDQVDGGYFEPHNWAARQFKSDVSNDRVKRHRERARNAECNVTTTVTVTPPETEQNTDKRERDAREGWVAGGSVLSRDAWEIAEGLMAASGKSADDPSLMGLVYAAQTWLNETIPKDFIFAKAIPLAGKHVNYIAKAVRSAWAEHRAQPPPAPVVGPQSNSTAGTRHAPTAKRSAIIEHLDRRIEEFREAEREPTGGAGAGPGRLLSHG